MTLRLTLVPTQNAEGEELGELVRAWAASTLRGKVRAEVELARTNKDVQDALMSDLVILDLSVAPEGEHNYDILARFPRYRDFMFLVSRTPVPFNVRWGANRAVPLFPRRQTNQEIVSWLAREISINTIDQYARGRLDRIKSYAGSAIQCQIWVRTNA